MADRFGKRQANRVLASVIKEHQSLVGKRLLASEWAREHFALGADMRWQPAPFQEQLLDVMAMDGGPEFIFLKKAAQVGYTTSILALIGYAMAHQSRGVVCYMPTDKVAQTFTKTHINPLIKHTPPLRGAREVLDDLRSQDTNTYKELNGKHLYVRGAVASDRFRLVVANYSILDEVDGYERDIEGEGSPVDLAHRSIRNQPFPRFIGGSTPTIESQSLIDEEVANCAMVFHYWLRCPHCGEAQVLDWEHIFFEGADKSIPWAEDVDRRADSARYIGECCWATWTYQDMVAALPDGWWGTLDGGERIETGGGRQPRLVDANGKPARWPSRIGFKIWSAYSPWFSWRSLVAGFLNAQSSIEKQRVFHNHSLGEAWREHDVDIDPDDLRQGAISLRLLPNHARLCVVAVDVQKDWLSWMLVAFGDAGEGWVLRREDIHGAMEEHDSVAWREMREAIEEVKGDLPVREDGHKIPLAGVALDSGNWSDTVYTVGARWQGIAPRVLLVKGGSGGFKQPFVTLPPSRVGLRGGGTMPLYVLGVDQGKIEVAHRLMPSDPERPHARLWLADTLDEAVYRELGAEQLSTKRNRQGRQVRAWRNKQERNEAFDQAVYALALVKIINPRWAKIAPVGDDEDAPTEAARVAPPPRPQPRGRPPGRIRRRRRL